MKRLEEPTKRHTSGKLPTHSNTDNLPKNFSGIPRDTLMHIMEAGGVINSDARPSRKAGELGLVDSCGKSFLWNLKEIENFLRTAGVQVKRKYVNQSPPEKTGSDPVWSNLTTIATYFNVSSSQIGQWIDAIDLRDEDGLPNKRSVNSGVGIIGEMSAGGKKTRKIGRWELHLTIQKLMEEGHPLDFDYSKTLRAKGKNSDVEVSSMDSRAMEFSKEFARLYNERSDKSIRLVQTTPKPILELAEKIIKKPGFILSGKYLERLNNA